MKLPMHLLKVLIGHVCVNLRSADVAMAEHDLHAANICTIHE